MSSWILYAALAIIIFFAVDSKRQQKPENNAIMEKMTYEVFDKDLVESVHLEYRPLALNTHKLNVTVVLARPVETLWLRFRLYYKYTYYQKYLIDVREDACAFFRGIENSPVAKILMENYNRMGVQFNFKLQCPLSGTLMAWNDRINSSHWKLPLMNAGRYRWDTTAMPSKYGKEYGVARAYVTISDFRVWF